MSVNNTSSSNDSISSQFPSFHPADCFTSVDFWYMQVSFNVTNIILLLPLSISVLYLGFQRFKQQRSVSSAAVMTLSDFVTYIMAVMELIGVLGSTLSIVSGYTNLPGMLLTGIYVGAFPWYGQMLFPILTSVERYLAVHPITYLRLRQANGVRIRNISTVCVWLHCFAAIGLSILFMEHVERVFIANICQMAFFLVAVTFCSLTVLCVLIRPRPGEASGDRVDQSKKRAFHTIMIIMGVLQLRFEGNLVSSVVGLSPAVSYMTVCGATISAWWCNLPSSLVLPLLFLHRAGKLPDSKPKTESG